MPSIKVNEIIKQIANQHDNHDVPEFVIKALNERNAKNSSTYDPLRKGTSQADLSVFNQGSTYRYILCIIDILSREFQAIPLRNKDADTVKDAFERMFDEKGFETTTIYTDQGTEFKNRILIDFLHARGINIHFTYVHRHTQLAIINSYMKIFHKILVGLESIQDYKNYTDTENRDEERRRRNNRLTNQGLPIPRSDRNEIIPQRKAHLYRWERYIDDAVIEINKHQKPDRTDIPDFDKPLINRRQYRNLLEVGDRVLIPLTSPTDIFTNRRHLSETGEKIPVGEYRRNPKKIYTISQVNIYPNQPVRYMVSDETGELNNISFNQFELQPID